MAEGRDAKLEARIRTVAASPLFDAAWYLEQYPDVAAAGEDPARHYAIYGAAERRSPGPSFDAEAYLTSYPDVAASGVNPLLHYITWGVAEGRDFQLDAQIRAVAASPLFDRDWYLRRYPMSPKLDSIRRGTTLLRAPQSVGRPVRTLTPMGTLPLYPDVEASGMNPLLHYVTWGRSEGRDLQLDARIRAVAASPLFDGDWYLRHYPDVAEAGLDPARHYAMRGAAERRSPGPDFDGDAYLTAYADVAADGANPLLHYMLFGMSRRSRSKAASGAGGSLPALGA